ncbi:GNAT family N-acetyltransferase [Paraburkholderia lacunae]|uniref:GNAT family N-acetyltransferase n=1 Tax=Paraburkholderia lacunae TaxID=2211104 RepID=A0A370N5J3_9BURK|nr:GNAT family N-acetyltransferase [Paraburkholderia lacunae]RDK00880.1 GNAT family N-acetyltransferase [Paraburkholderia lacunae]
MTKIETAGFPQHLEVVRAIFREYASSLGIDLSFQNFEAELAGLPGRYAEPHGRILLASNEGQVIGCVAMRPLDATTCEMKRLYVRPAGRGQQLGKQLAASICRIAKEAGYARIVLDTLPDMRAAQQLYASFGFKAVAAYTFNPVAGTQFLELDLTEWGNQVES